MSQLLDMTTSWKENLLTKTCQITNSLFLFSGKIYLCLYTRCEKERWLVKYITWIALTS